MLDRLLGLETEYAIRYSAAGDEPRPDHQLIYEAMSSAIAERVASGAGSRRSHGQRFVENGGAFYYEFVPSAPAGGVIEASTPECRGPSQLLLYQKAQERLLIDALPHAERTLARLGYPGSLGLLKNCRDAEGHVYGAQENYEVELASGPALWAYRACLTLLLPLALLSAGLALISTLSLGLVLLTLLLVTLLLAALWGLVVPRHQALLDRLFPEHGERPALRLVMQILNAVSVVLTAPVTWLYSLCFRGLCCRRIRRDALGFLLSRPVISGAGSYDPRTRSFGLSEKGPAIRRLVRSTSMPADRSVFDIGHLVKRLFCLANLELRPLLGLYARRQRLQLGLSDSNLAQTAEYLKVATTALVLDMAEAGALASLPRLRRPLSALRQLIADSELRAKVPCSDGRVRGAVELQRLYLDAARRFVADAPAASLEVHELLRRWAEVLDALETEPARLFGRLDWVSKRSLLEQAGAGLGDADKQKIDLKYHELACGYLARLELEGLAPVLVDADEVARALRAPPDDSPARRRSQLLRSFAAEGVAARVSWDRVEIPTGRLRKQVIRLDDYRSR